MSSKVPALNFGTVAEVEIVTQCETKHPATTKIFSALQHSKNRFLEKLIFYLRSISLWLTFSNCKMFRIFCKTTQHFDRKKESLINIIILLATFFKIAAFSQFLKIRLLEKKTVFFTKKPFFERFQKNLLLHSHSPICFNLVMKNFQTFHTDSIISHDSWIGK